MATGTLTIDRTSLSKPALVFEGSDSDAALWFETVGRPGKTWRRGYASPSSYLDGSVITEATLDVSSVPLRIGARAASVDALEDLQDEVDEAFSQLTFTATFTMNGRSREWPCDVSDIAWDDPEPGAADAALCQASVALQVQPKRSGY